MCVVRDLCLDPTECLDPIKCLRIVHSNVLCLFVLLCCCVGSRNYAMTKEPLLLTVLILVIRQRANKTRVQEGVRDSDSFLSHLVIRVL